MFDFWNAYIETYIIETKQLNNCNTQVEPVLNDSYYVDRHRIFLKLNHDIYFCIYVLGYFYPHSFYFYERITYVRLRKCVEKVHVRYEGMWT